ncbi:hypothetical protein ACX0G7_02220 [Flavitalea antarctica]
MQKQVYDNITRGKAIAPRAIAFIGGRILYLPVVVKKEEIAPGSYHLWS